VSVKRPQPAFVDDRGAITDILTKEPIEYVTLITSRAGAVRGHHYHRETHQWIYVLSGRLRMLTQLPGEPVRQTDLDPGDLIVNVPNESHAMIALSDASFLVFTRGPRGGEDYERDTYRLAAPLRAPGDAPGEVPGGSPGQSPDGP
jgi:oxalate decarboxylase/phosphoglucose isomerase-like protein (cupin superfamily)